MGLKRSFIAALINVVLPALIISTLSPDDILGPSIAFLLALVLPLAYGIVYFFSRNKLSVFSVIGLLSIILTGSFGFLELSPMWMVAKETGIPLILGIVIFYTGYRKRPFMRILLSEILDLKAVAKDYEKNSNTQKLLSDITKTNSLFASVFLIGATLNFFVAFYVLNSTPGTPEYASEVAKLTAISYPLIVFPVVIMLFIVFALLASYIEGTTGKEITEYMKD